jgi:hypothetical protein
MKEAPPIPEPAGLIRLLIDFCQLPPRDDHFNAVQLVCSSALEYYRGVLTSIKDQNALAAKALSRSLLEALSTAVILAKHPEKLSDFRDCGRYTSLRFLKSQDQEFDPIFTSGRENTIKKHGSDYLSLDARFRNKSWHGFKKRAALLEAGFERHIYDDFYRPISEMAHGEPAVYVMRNEKDEWIFGRSDLKETRYRAGAFMASSSFLVAALRQINRVLGLSLGDRIESVAKTLYDFSPEYRKLMFETGRHAGPVAMENAINQLSKLGQRNPIKIEPR